MLLVAGGLRGCLRGSVSGLQYAATAVGRRCFSSETPTAAATAAKETLKGSGPLFLTSFPSYLSLSLSLCVCVCVCVSSLFRFLCLHSQPPVKKIIIVCSFSLSLSLSLSISLSFSVMMIH